MATYIIGDVHGCYDSLRRLLALIEYDEARDRVLMTGDLVNGGPESGEVVRWAKAHRAGVVLGNHDLHLLAVAAGGRSPGKKDTFSDLLRADDGDELLEWLRTRPLVIQEDEFLLVHAGLLPEWDLATAARLAGEAEAALRSKGSDAEFFRSMYGDEPSRWSEELAGMDRIRIIINGMTRMRLVRDDGAIELQAKGPVEKAPAGLRPWFVHPRRAALGRRVFFGHWAALGFYDGSGHDVVGLDSGCVWGGKLTAWRVDDSRVFQVESEMA